MLCLNEWNQVSVKVKEFLKNGMRMPDTNGSLNPFMESKSRLYEYDRYMIQISDVMNLLRRINIYLSFIGISDHNISDYCFCKFPQGFLEEDDSLNTITWTTRRNDDHHSVSEKTMIRALEPAKPEKQKPETGGVRFLYNMDYIIKVHVTYIEDYSKMLFYVCDVHDYQTILKIGNIKDLHPLDKSPKSLLSDDSVFAVSNVKRTQSKNCFSGLTNDFIWRAKFLEDEYDILLIDSGEIVKVNDSINFYTLPLEYSSMPPLVLYCVLKGVMSRDSDSFQDPQFELLCDVETKVIVLHIDPAFNADEQEYHNSNSMKTLPVYYYGEETKADDKETAVNNNSNNEQQDSQLKNSDNVKNITICLSEEVEEVHDPEESKQEVIESWEPGSIAEITFTHIEHMWEFYGFNIDYPLHPDLPALSWEFEQLTEKSQPTNGFAVGDVVMAFYKMDGLWYRGRVISVNPDEETYKVSVLNGTQLQSFEPLIFGFFLLGFIH